MVNCPVCHDRRHVWESEVGAWKRCGCAGGRRAAEAVAAEGAVEAEPLLTWGGTCSKFVRRGWAGRGVFVVRGDLGSIEGCGLSIMSASEANDKKARMVRLAEIVELSFLDKGKDKKIEVVKGAISADIAIVVCGNEPRHSWNGPTLAAILGRRNAAKKPTFVVCNHDPLGLYGSAVAGLIPEDAPSWEIGT